MDFKTYKNINEMLNDNENLSIFEDFDLNNPNYNWDLIVKRDSDGNTIPYKASTLWRYFYDNIKHLCFNSINWHTKKFTENIKRLKNGMNLIDEHKGKWYWELIIKKIINFIKGRSLKEIENIDTYGYANQPHFVVNFDKKSIERIMGELEIKI